MCGADRVHEMVGFAGRVASAGVMVEAEAFPFALHALGLAGHGRVGVSDALSGFDDGEIIVGGAGDVRGLPAGHVDAVHVGHRRGRDREHGEQRDEYREQSLSESGGGHAVVPLLRVKPFHGCGSVEGLRLVDGGVLLFGYGVG